MSTQTEPGQDIFLCLTHIKPGQWQIRNNLITKLIGQISRKLAKPEGWIRIQRVEGRSNSPDTHVLWTSERDHHDSSTGPALGLVINYEGQLIQVSMSAEKMEPIWQRGKDLVGDENYHTGLKVAISVEQAILLDLRAWYWD